MQLRCVCGHPVFLSAVWKSVESYLAARDRTRNESSPPIIYCPQCGQALTLDALAHQWTTHLDGPPRPDAGPEAADQGSR